MKKELFKFCKSKQPWRSFKLSLKLFFIFVLVGCDSSPSDYPIYESGANSTNRPLSWLDNQRVIFHGLASIERGLTSKEYHEKSGIHIWDTKTNQVSLYKKGKSFCYFDGYISFVDHMNLEEIRAYEEKIVSKNNRRIQAPSWEGKMGNEVYHDHYNNFGLNESYENFQRSRFSCKWYRSPPLGSELLLNEGEYIYTRESENRMREVVYALDNKEMILPITVTGYVTVRYSIFNDKYLIRSTFASEMNMERCGIKKCFPLWWLNRDGTLEKELMPYYKLPANTDNFLALTNGFIAVSHHPPKDSRGMYLITDNEHVKRVAGGFIREPAVSPDGCKVAYNHHSGTPSLKVGNIRLGNNTGITVKMIDFCSENNH